MFRIGIGQFRFLHRRFRLCHKICSFLCLLFNFCRALLGDSLHAQRCRDHLHVKGLLSLGLWPWLLMMLVWSRVESRSHDRRSSNMLVRRLLPIYRHLIMICSIWHLVTCSRALLTVRVHSVGILDSHRCESLRQLDLLPLLHVW